MLQENREIRPDLFVDTQKENPYHQNASVKRGDIVLISFDGVGSEQRGLRPAVILQNDIGNQNSTTVLVAPLTTKLTKANIPTHVFLSKDRTSLKADSTVLLEQVRVMDKCRMLRRVACVCDADMEKINLAIKVSFGLV